MSCLILEQLATSSPPSAALPGCARLSELVRCVEPRLRCVASHLLGGWSLAPSRAAALQAGAAAGRPMHAVTAQGECFFASGEISARATGRSGGGGGGGGGGGLALRDVPARVTGGAAAAPEQASARQLAAQAEARRGELAAARRQGERAEVESARRHAQGADAAGRSAQAVARLDKARGDLAARRAALAA